MLVRPSRESAFNDILDYAICADDKTPYACRLNFAEAINFIEPNFKKIFGEFKENEDIAKLVKVFFFVSPDDDMSLRISNSL